MAKLEVDQQLLPSVLDRLLDDEPDVAREVARNRSQVLRELKQSVRRDLENLLNTRFRCKGHPAHLDELEQSLVNYGIPDFTGANLGSAQDRERYRRVLEATIRTFEPRLKNVAIRFSDTGDQVERLLHFRIDAVLRAEESPVVYDTSLEPSTGTIEVMGLRR